MSHWLNYQDTLCGWWVLFSSVPLVWSSSCGIGSDLELHKLWNPKRKVPAPCGLSTPRSVVELKGQQISSSTVFMLNGMETTSKSKEFTWCHCDFFPIVTFYKYKGGRRSSANTGDVTRSSFSCSGAACSQLVRMKWSGNMLHYDSQLERFSPNNLQMNNTRKTITGKWQQKILTGPYVIFSSKQP